MALLAVIPLLVGSKQQRLLAIAALALSAFLIVSDYNAGVKFQRQIKEKFDRVRSSSNQEHIISEKPGS